jgi:ABC-type spermidine/putrescine transport system permease subunit II
MHALKEMFVFWNFTQNEKAKIDVGGGWKCYKSLTFSQIFHFLLLPSFPITFFSSSTSPWHALWHGLYMTNFKDDSKGKSPFQYPAHLSLTLPTLTSSTITLLFLYRSNKLATDIDTLAAGIDTTCGQIRYWAHGITKNMEQPWRSFFRCTPIPL